MNNLIIGDKSQISLHLPQSFDRINSRNIIVPNKRYDNVYITFSEQRTYDISLSEKDFIEVNVNLTEKAIDKCKRNTNRIYVFGTTELWNNMNTAITINDTINYTYSPYIKSKEAMLNMIIDKRNRESLDIVVLHPTNFNSLYRRDGFLFSKIYRSIIFEEKINVGNLNFDRDVIHASYLCEKILTTDSDSLIGAGKKINIRKFVSELFESFDKKMTDYISEAQDCPKNNYYWVKTENIYNSILEDTIKEIKNYERNKAGQ